MKRIAQNIYSYKSELMGVAILMIMFFHTILPEGAPKWLLILKSYGDAGVDLFMLLGGFTIAGSYLRTKGVISFYKKRLIRILPAYLVVWGTWHAILAIRYSEGYLSFLAEITFWNNIVNNNLAHWFIPAILLMYLLTPLYIVACKKFQWMQVLPLVVVIGGAFLMCANNSLVIPFFMFWLRLPIYLLGVVLYLHRESRFAINSKLMLFVLISAVVCARLCVIYHWTNDFIGFRRYFFMILAVGIVYFYKGKNRLLAWLGGITLELYLLHELIQGLFYDLLSPPWYVYIPVSIILAIGIGSILHKTLSYTDKNSFSCNSTPSNSSSFSQ